MQRPAHDWHVPPDSNAGKNVSTVSILTVPVARLGFDEALSAVAERLAEDGGGSIIFANVHSITESQDNPELRRAMEAAHLVLADGMPLVWASHLARQPIASRVCGPDFMRAMLERHPTERHGFLGGLPGQATEIARRFGVKAVQYSPPFRSFAPQHVREDVARLLEASGDLGPPRILWVGLGAPKQELWMHEAAPLLPHTLLFGVGAAFDFLSGTKPRAPVLMQRVGLEWLFRLGSEPRRLAGRYARTNTRFLYEVLSTRAR